jgi:hypothetical protein
METHTQRIWKNKLFSLQRNELFSPRYERGERRKGREKSARSLGQWRNGWREVSGKSKTFPRVRHCTQASQACRNRRVFFSFQQSWATRPVLYPGPRPYTGYQTAGFCILHVSGRAKYCVVPNRVFTERPNRVLDREEMLIAHAPFCPQIQSIRRRRGTTAADLPGLLCTSSDTRGMDL